MVMSRHYNVGQDHNLNTVNKTFQNVVKFRQQIKTEFMRKLSVN